MNGQELIETLTRLRIQHPGWLIYQRADTTWIAYHGMFGLPDEESVTAPTVAALEVELAGR